MSKRKQPEPHVYYVPGNYSRNASFRVTADSPEEATAKVNRGEYDEIDDAGGETTDWEATGTPVVGE